MPRRDGTGPAGKAKGPGAGGSMGGGTGSGFGGNCVCSTCGSKTSHARGIPCSSQKCPKCGAAMVRE